MPMKTNWIKILSLLMALCLTVGIFAGCQSTDGNTDPTGTTAGADELAPFVDYVVQTTLDMDSNTAKQEVTVKSFIDGDTTHFNVPESVRENGILKARYLAVNTPESTGKIEEWGKKASTFTKEKLKNAKSIIIESDDDKWNADSTGDRFLVWVWYQPEEGGEYRNLNLELVQSGLSIACGTVELRYGSATTAAFQQAKAHKLFVFSGEADPDFYYGDAYEIDLKGLRTNIELYDNRKVAFEGVVTRINNNSAYIEEYDPETGLYYGISAYYGFATGKLLTILKVGHRVRVVGTVTYYETGGTWQVSDLSYREFKPKDPGNTQLISEGNAAGNVLTDPKTFVSSNVELEVLAGLEGEETVTKTFKYADLVMSTSISMKDLYVKDVYTTHNGGDNDGAMTLTCEVDGTYITVRTIVLYDEAGNMLTQDAFLGKTIDVTGVVDYFSGDYQIKVFTANDIVIHE